MLNRVKSNVLQLALDLSHRGRTAVKNLVCKNIAALKLTDKIENV